MSLTHSPTAPEHTVAPHQQTCESSRLGTPTDIFKKIDEDLARGRFDYVGDPADFKLVYLTMASTLHAHVPSIARPVGSFIVGKTSTGKTELLYSVAKLFPAERQINLTTISPRAHNAAVARSRQN